MRLLHPPISPLIINRWCIRSLPVHHSAQSIRKFTISGKNIFPDAVGSTTFRDINVSDNGLILAVDATGQIYEYDLNGTMLFEFGAQDKGDQRLGTLRNPTAIERYQDFIYVLDKDKNAIVCLSNNGFCKDKCTMASVCIWKDFTMKPSRIFEDVLNFNGSFIMSYQAIADAYFKEPRLSETALTAYKYAEDRSGYSQAFWELRNYVLQHYLDPGNFVAVRSVGGLGVESRGLKNASNGLIQSENGLRIC